MLKPPCTRCLTENKRKIPNRPLRNIDHTSSKHLHAIIMLCNSSLRTWSTDRGYSPTSILALKRGSNSKHQARQLWLTLVFLSRCSKNRQSETSTIALLLRVLLLELQAQRNRRQLVLGALTPMETHHHYVQAILLDNRLWPPLTFKDLGSRDLPQAYASQDSDPQSELRPKQAS